MMTATGKRRSELTVMNAQKRSEPARASIDACYHATRLASTSRGSLVSRRAADRHGNWAALLPLPAAPDPLVTGLVLNSLTTAIALQKSERNQLAVEYVGKLLVGDDRTLNTVTQGIFWAHSVHLRFTRAVTPRLS